VHSDELRALLDKVSERLQSSSEDTSGVERIKENSALYEVVGKWPPDGLLPAPQEEIESALDVLEKARLGLMAVDPYASEAAQLGGVIFCARAHLIEANAAGGSGATIGDSDDASELVGPWPPN
jgi:hypothetical protein